MSRWILLLTLSLLVTSCSTPKRDGVPLSVDLPEALEASVIQDEWWMDLETDELESIIETALNNSQDLEMALANVDAANASARIAGAGLSPQVTAGAGSVRNKQVFVGLPIPGPGVLSSHATTHQLNLNLSWELDVWGRLRAGRRAANQDVLASRIDFAAVRLSIAGQVTKAWLAASYAAEQLRLAEANIDVFRVSEIQAQERYERGLQSSLDVRLARSNLANAEAEVETWKLERKRALRRMSLLMGGFPDADESVALALPELPNSFPEKVGSELLKRRPDLMAAEARVYATNDRVAEAQAARYPRFSLTSSVGTTSDKLKDLVDRSFSIWSLAGNVAAPILDGGRLKAGVDAAKASTRRTVADYEKRVLTAFEEVEGALDAETLLREREKKLRSAAQEAEAAYELAQSRYREGLEIYVTVLEAQRRWIDSQRQLMTLKHLRLDNRVTLYLALGGGFGTGNEESAKQEKE